MSKSKLSKRQVAGALLLSSTVIGATASGTVSAGFMDFMNTIGSVAGKVGNGVTLVTLLGIIAYGTYRAIKAGINYYNFRNARNNLLGSINEFLDYLSFHEPLIITFYYDRKKTKTKKSYENIIEYLDIDGKQITNNLNELKKSVKNDFNMNKAKETIDKAKETIDKAKETINKDKETINIDKEIINIDKEIIINKVKEYKNKILEDLIELFKVIEKNYERYCEEYDKLDGNK